MLISFQANNQPRFSQVIKPRLLASVVVLSPLSGEAAGLFTGLYSFGDSLTDSGNIFAATAGAFPYPSGRFSNGPTWAEQLATDYMGLASHGPSLAGGNNHAWGGARTAETVSPLAPRALPPSVISQVGGFVLAGGAFASGDLVTIWGGANDFFDTLEAGGAVADPIVSAAQIGTALDEVLGAGAQNVLILNLPDLGATPDQRGGPEAGLASSWTNGFNAALASEIAARRTPGINLFEADIFGLGQQFAADPGAFGLVNVTDPVVPGGVLDPATTAYWDGVHPTETVHGLFAQEAATAVGIPEPSTAFLALTALALALPRRRVS